MGIKHHVQKMVDYIHAESSNRDRIGVSRLEASSPLSRRLRFAWKKYSVSRFESYCEGERKVERGHRYSSWPVEKWQDCTHEGVGGCYEIELG